VEFLAKAAALLPPEPLDTTSWDRWVEQLKPATGRKGKALFMPLRKALTGRENGPELRNLLPLIGRDRAVKRLKGATA
jgi:glutamyl-tRNA synthetase